MTTLTKDRLIEITPTEEVWVTIENGVRECKPGDFRNARLQPGVTYSFFTTTEDFVLSADKALSAERIAEKPKPIVDDPKVDDGDRTK